MRPIGAQHEVPVDVRILSATQKDLGPLATDGRFRQDLYYRINVIELHAPPLRARREDIPRAGKGARGPGRGPGSTYSSQPQGSLSFTFFIQNIRAGQAWSLSAVAFYG